MEFIENKTAIEEMLSRCEWGTLSMCDGGRPYAVQLNYAYVYGKIIFHCALKGRKLNVIEVAPDVCFSIGGQSGLVHDHGQSCPRNNKKYPKEEACHLDHWSVLVFGRDRIVTDIAEKAKLANAFNRSFNPQADDINERRLKGCAIVEISVNEMTARSEEDRKRKFWRYSFE